VQQTRLVSSVAPLYPALARQARVRGTVKLHLIINTRGGVQIVDVLSGHPLLIPAARDAVKQWQYEPTKLNGVDVEVDTTVDVPFSLPADEAQR
jgi:protein TonB